MGPVSVSVLVVVKVNSGRMAMLSDTCQITPSDTGNPIDNPNWPLSCATAGAAWASNATSTANGKTLSFMGNLQCENSSIGRRFHIFRFDEETGETVGAKRVRRAPDPGKRRDDQRCEANTLRLPSLVKAMTS